MRHIIACDQGFITDEKVYFLSVCTKALYELKVKEKKLKYLSTVPDKRDGFRLYTQCIKFGNNIFCFPDTGEYIWKYDLANNSWKCIELYILGNLRAETRFMYVDGTKAYLFSLGLMAIICFDLNDEKVVDCAYTNIDSERKRDNVVYDKGRIFVLPDNTPVFFEINASGIIIEKYEASFMPGGIRTISVFGDELWISGKQKRVYRIKKEEIVEVSLDCYYGLYKSNNDSVQLPLFFSSRVLNNDLWMIPYTESDICCINQSGKIEMISPSFAGKPCSNLMNELGSMYTYIGEFDNKWMLLYCTQIDSLVIVDAVNKTVQRVRIKIDNLHNRLFDSEMIIWEEDSVFSFEDFLETI